MAYIWQRWLADEFRAAGLTVVEIEGWENRGRPASTGNFDPTEGITDHHTGTRSSAANPAPSLQTLITGRPDLPGPLAQWAVAFDGVVFVIAAGRANHAGRVGKSGAPGMPLGADGNARALGDEIMTDGTQTMPDAQRRAVAVTNAVALKRQDNPVDRVHRHADISGTGKWDLGNRTTLQLRTDARVALAALNEEDDMPDKKTLQSWVRSTPIATLVGPQKIRKDRPLEKVLEDLEETQERTITEVRKVKGLLQALTDQLNTTTPGSDTPKA